MTTALHKKKESLARCIPKAMAMLKNCTLCPRMCRVDRLKGEKGYCDTADRAKVYGYMPHHGEEPPLSGSKGSGTLFFSHCNLCCCFCQNHDISIQGEGDPADPEQIARAMIHLQEQGCHNINFVTPTHVVPFILKAADLALDMGLTLPLVYNSSGYETPETLALLDGIMDIYLPDFKFWDKDLARLACNAPDYPKIARAAVKIMHAQAGNLKIDANGIARSGLLVRHLFMPGTLADTKKILKFLKTCVSPDTRINLMSQYRPLWQAEQVPAFCRPADPNEFRAAVKAARDLGFFFVS